MRDSRTGKVSSGGGSESKTGEGESKRGDDGDDGDDGSDKGPLVALMANKTDMEVSGSLFCS